MEIIENKFTTDFYPPKKLKLAFVLTSLEPDGKSEFKYVRKLKIENLCDCCWNTYNFVD